MQGCLMFWFLNSFPKTFEKSPPLSTIFQGKCQMTNVKCQMSYNSERSVLKLRCSVTCNCVSSMTPNFTIYLLTFSPAGICNNGRQIAKWKILKFAIISKLLYFKSNVKINLKKKKKDVNVCYLIPLFHSLTEHIWEVWTESEI